jgi:hypothetical protein
MKPTILTVLRSRHLVHVSRIVIALAVVGSSGCGGGGDGDDSGLDAGLSEPGSNEHAPRFLSLGTNSLSITQGQSVVFTAVLTDPDGIDDLIGGSLTSPDGAIQYGAFATGSQEGAYSLSLSWSEMNQAVDITFGTMEARDFRAVFFDVDGNAIEKNVTVKLTCNGKAACRGTCATSCTLWLAQRVSCNQACVSAAASCYPGGPNWAVYDFGEASAASDLPDCSTVPDATNGSATFEALRCACIPMD